MSCLIGTYGHDDDDDDYDGGAQWDDERVGRLQAVSHYTVQ